jgi:hypothetical protein
MDVPQFRSCVTCTATTDRDKLIVYQAVPALRTLYSFIPIQIPIQQRFEHQSWEPRFPNQSFCFKRPVEHISEVCPKYCGTLCIYYSVGFSLLEVTVCLHFLHISLT